MKAVNADGRVRDRDHRQTEELWGSKMTLQWSQKSEGIQAKSVSSGSFFFESLKFNFFLAVTLGPEGPSLTMRTRVVLWKARSLMVQPSLEELRNTLTPRCP